MKLRNNNAGIPALTPNLAPSHCDRFVEVQLKDEVRRLRAALNAETRRHHRLEAAVSKYIAILEGQVALVREAFTQKGTALVPSELGRPARKH